MDFADLAVNDLRARIEAIPELASKAFYVIDQETLLSDSPGLKPPFVGIIYNGMVPDQQKGAKGLNVMLSCMVAVVTTGVQVGSTKTTATILLDKIRNVIKDTTSPTGHFWEFSGEELAPFSNQMYVYLQEWQTRAMLTQGA